MAIDRADGQPDLVRWQFGGAGHDFIARGIAVSGAFAPAFRRLVKRRAKPCGIRLPDQAHVADARQRGEEANKALILAQGLFLDAFAALHLVHARHHGQHVGIESVSVYLGSRGGLRRWDSWVCLCCKQLRGTVPKIICRCVDISQGISMPVPSCGFSSDQ